MVIFKFLTLKLVLTVFKHLRKCSFFFTRKGGGKMIKDFRKTIKFKDGQFSFFDSLQLPHTVISNSEKLAHPTVYQC